MKRIACVLVLMGSPGCSGDSVPLGCASLETQAPGIAEVIRTSIQLARQDGLCFEDAFSQALTECQFAECATCAIGLLSQVYGEDAVSEDCEQSLIPDSLRESCPDLLDTDLLEAIIAFEAVRDEGTTRQEVEQSSRDNCETEAPDQADCVPCLLAIIGEVWP